MYHALLLLLLLLVVLCLSASAFAGQGAHATSPKSLYIDIDSQTYRLRYFNIGSIVYDAEVDKSQNKLRLFVNTTDEGVMEIELPRAIIASADQNGNDKPFVVHTIGNDDNNNTTTTTFIPAEIENREDVRMVAFNYPKDTRVIEISGTYVVPEFGSISMLVMAAGIVSILVMLSRLSGWGVQKD